MHLMRTLSSISLLSLVACGGGSTAPNSGSSSCTASLSATVNGVAWCSPAGAGHIPAFDREHRRNRRGTHEQHRLRLWRHRAGHLFARIWQQQRRIRDLHEEWPGLGEWLVGRNGLRHAHDPHGESRRRHVHVRRRALERRRDGDDSRHERNVQHHILGAGPRLHDSHEKPASIICLVHWPPRAGNPRLVGFDADH